MRSLPTPLSPVSRTGASDCAIRWARVSTLRMARLRAIRSPLGSSLGSSVVIQNGSLLAFQNGVEEDPLRRPGGAAPSEGNLHGVGPERAEARGHGTDQFVVLQ